jgi:type II secretory pathway pseudopilin PulG
VKSKQAGTTLLEMILIIVVMAGLLGMSYRFYNFYTYEQNLSLVRQQVGLIFDAMRLYYAANCNVYNSGHTLAQTINKTVIVLQGPGGGSYNSLAPYLSTPIIRNILLNTSDANFYYGYFAEFTVNTGASILPATTVRPYGGDGSTKIATVLNWTAHVAIEPAKVSQLSNIFNSLGANCGTTFISSTSGVVTCTTALGGVYGTPTCAFIYNGSTCVTPALNSDPDSGVWTCPQYYCASNCSLPFCNGSGSLVQHLVTPPIDLTSATLIEWEQGAEVGGGFYNTNQATMPRLRRYKQQFENNAWQGFMSGGAAGGPPSDGTNYYYCGS